MKITIQDFRSDGVHMAYWFSVLSIEENAEIYPVEYLEAA